MVSISDDFNRADGSPNPNPGGWDWVHVGGWTGTEWAINNNEIRRVNTDGTLHVLGADFDLDSDDHYAQIDVTAFDSNSSANRACAMVRIPGTHAETGYQARVDRDFTSWEIRIDRLDAGSRTTIAGPSTVSPSIPFTLRCEAEGSTIRALIDGVEELSVTDGNISGSLQTGIAGNVRVLDDVREDNFEAGDLAAFDPANLQASVLGSDVTLTHDSSF